MDKISKILEYKTITENVAVAKMFSPAREIYWGYADLRGEEPSHARFEEYFAESLDDFEQKMVDLFKLGEVDD